MTLRASLLRELENQNLSVDRRAVVCCELARELEDKGEYEKARKALSAYWKRIDERPKLAGLEPSAAAEVLLRAGVLTGLLQSQITDAQEKAKNLISESLRIFQTQRYKKKIAEAQTELALCYWRTGEIDNARDVLTEALSYLATESEVKAKAIIRLAIVELEAAEYDEGLRILTEHALLFQKINNQTIRGSYHVTLANMLEWLWETEKRTEYLDRALVEYAAASYYFERAEHKRYLANVENNLGLIYFKIYRCAEAHEHLDRARRILVGLKDTVTIAQVDETRACVFLKQNHITEAERVARFSVRSLEKSGCNVLLAEALTTHGRALARLGNYGIALSTFRRAIALAEHAGNLNRVADAALAAFQEIGIAEGDSLASGRTFNEAKQLLEHEFIKRALDAAQGSITHAARSLGMSHQALDYMLHTRHKDLLEKRKPPRRDSRK
jgi:tetratricopeptide (TPR) repeat protein